VASGMVRRDAGEVRVNGIPRSLGSARAARAQGIGMVHQHFTAIPAMTVAENIALFAGWSGPPRQLRERAREAAESAGLPLDPEQRAGRLSVALKQRLEIVKALAADARILLLDEPTAVLAPPEAEELLKVVRVFTAAGGAAVLITHKLDEALRYADRVTVLRHGSVTYTGTAATETRESLARAMIGTGPELPFLSSRTSVEPNGSVAGPALVRLDALEVSRESGYGLAVRSASLVVHGGEIVGVAGVEGNGQRELLRAVAGRIMPLRGRVEVARPLGFVPEDRSTEGLIPELSLAENLVLSADGSAGPRRRGRIPWRAVREETSALLKEYGVTATGPNAKAATLSGGNQQKLILARELSHDPQVIVAENPTRGLDLSAATAIHGRLRSAAERGAAVLFYSSDLDEVLSLSGRMVVMAQGNLRPVPAGASRTDVGNLMLGETKPT
jgi:ABC-type uncharacterized transport system ATPase subunit